MDALSPEEMIEQLNLVILSLEANESVYYVALDLIYQVKEEIKQISFEEDDTL
jgi:hypothetical protein